jgi:hypothetical protein
MLLVSLAWLLGACGGNGLPSPSVTSPNPLSIIQTLEQDLNQGNANQALELFSEDGVVVEISPNPNTIDQTSGYLIIGPYYIPRAYSAAAAQTYYRGQEEINTYLAKLLEQQFQSNGSLFQEDEEGITWVCQASSQMVFKATIQNGQIKSLRVTLF